jgi:hypothetical protein
VIKVGQIAKKHGRRDAISASDIEVPPWEVRLLGSNATHARTTIETWRKDYPINDPRKHRVG